MWLVSYAGDGEDVLQGKRVWLRPGTACLFGRTSGKPSTGERCFYIADTRISRKHVVFRAANSELDSSTRLHARTTVTITDGSKKGTTIDGEKIVQGDKELNGSKGIYVVKLGDTGHAFKLEWREVVVAFTGVSGKAKKTGTAITAEKQKLNGCDVKLTTGYVTNETTHAVAKKRNTSPGLQALVEGRWLVTDSWVEALVQAVKKTGPLGTSPLEEDFDCYWPSEANFIVPAGSEPNPRPNDYLKPDSERAQVFADYTFVFLSQAQYESLMPVILGGGGKAAHMNYRPSTSVESFLAFAEPLLKEREHGQLPLSQESGPGGLVVVRLNDKDENREAAMPFMDDLSFTLNQRTIEQNELLDAILVKDASSFRRPLRYMTQAASQENYRHPNGMEASSSFPRPPETSQRQVRESPPVDSQGATPAEQRLPGQQPMIEQAAEELPLTRRRNRRMFTQPRKIDFDDFDPSQFAPKESKAQESDASSQRQNDPPSVQAMDLDKPAGEPSQNVAQKRHAEADLVKEEGIDEKLYPGMAAMKRRKIQALKRGQQAEQESPEAEVHVIAEKHTNGKNAKVKVKKETEIDIRATMKKRREEEEEARRKDEEALEEALNTDLENMKVNVVIEQFDPPSAPPFSIAAEAGVSTGQNPAWNGRPNFKKFRSNKLPRDHDPPARLDRQGVVITLVEVPTRSQGLGDEYWLETGRDTERRRGYKSQSKSQASSIAAPRQSGAAGYGDGMSDEDDTTAFRRRLQRSRQEDRDEEVIPAQLNPEDTQTQGRATKKRGALEALLGEKPPPAKKPRAAASKAATSRAKTAATINIDDDDEDESVSFRRRRF